MRHFDCNICILNVKVKVMHISMVHTILIPSYKKSDMGVDRLGKHSYCHQMLRRISACDYHIWILHWPIAKVEVKVMPISTAFISKMVTDRADKTIATEYEVAHGLSISILIFYLRHSKSQGHGKTQFDCDAVSGQDSLVPSSQPYEPYDLR